MGAHALVVFFDSRLSGYRLILAASHLQATIRRLLAYCMLRLTQPPTHSGTENA